MLGRRLRVGEEYDADRRDAVGSGMGIGFRDLGLQGFGGDVQSDGKVGFNRWPWQGSRSRMFFGGFRFFCSLSFPSGSGHVGAVFANGS